jgi:hypothetical protein
VGQRQQGGGHEADGQAKGVVGTVRVPHLQPGQARRGRWGYNPAFSSTSTGTQRPPWRKYGREGGEAEEQKGWAGGGLFLNWVGLSPNCGWWAGTGQGGAAVGNRGSYIVPILYLYKP